MQNRKTQKRFLKRFGNQDTRNTSGVYVTLDIGTTRMKAMAFTVEGLVLCKVSLRLSKYSPEVGWVEQDPVEILQGVQRLLRKIRVKLGVRKVLRFGLCTQRETVIAWDRKTGAPAYAAISWEDQRTKSTCEQLANTYHLEVLRKTGLPIDAYFSATKMRWILDHVGLARELEAQGRLVLGTVDTWILAQLCAGNPVYTDVTNASRTLVFNIRSQAWDDELLRIFGVPAHALATVKNSVGEFGTLRKEIFGYSVPVAVVCGDQQASMAAVGFGRGMTKITYGTGVFVMQSIGGIAACEKELRAVCAGTRQRYVTVLPTSGEARYAVEIKGLRSGELVTPYLRMPNALEPVLRTLAKDTDQAIESLPIVPDVVYVDGGVSQSQRLLEMQASLSGVAIVRKSISEGACLGLLRLMREGSIL